MLKNELASLQLAKDGFVLLDANLETETEQLESFVSKHFSPDISDFYYSLMANTFEQNFVIRDTIREILTPFYEAHFKDYRTITESFLAKPAHTANELLLHQDWCYTDEKKFSAYNVWIPLCDVSPENGTMIFLPGSHLWFNNLRSATLPTARIATKDFPSNAVKTVELKKGQALIFHPAAFHGSYPNHTGQNRTVVTSTVLNNDAPFLFYRKAEMADEVNIFELPDDAFLANLEKLAMGGMPETNAIDSIHYVHKVLTVGDLKGKH